MCIAWVLTGAPGTVPLVRAIYNRTRLSWTQTVNGTGTIFLPLDPHARTARLIAANPTPSATALTDVSFSSAGWVGSSHCYLTPGASTIGYNSSSWLGMTPCAIFTNNVINDVTVSSLNASFDHSQLRSHWQVFQTQHELGSTSASRDELLLGMGIKSHAVTDYSSGIAINFAGASNVHFSWELIR